MYKCVVLYYTILYYSVNLYKIVVKYYYNMSRALYNHNSSNSQTPDTSFFDRVKDVYDLGDRMGTTDYIDFLTQDEVPKNIMSGYDCYQRRFITLKVGGYDLDSKKFFRTGQVFFQRYSDEPYIAGADFEGLFIWITGGARPAQYQLINDLVDKKVVKIKEEHRFNSSKNNCIIASMDYWEEKAAKVIQKFWRNCYYHPEHKVRQKILNRQFDDYSSGVDTLSA